MPSPSDALQPDAVRALAVKAGFETVGTEIVTPAHCSTLKLERFAALVAGLYSTKVADLKRQLGAERDGRMRAEALLDDTRRANESLRITAAPPSSDARAVAGVCPKCGNEVLHRPMKAGEFDHQCAVNDRAEEKT